MWCQLKKICLLSLFFTFIFNRNFHPVPQKTETSRYPSPPSRVHNHRSHGVRSRLTTTSSSVPRQWVFSGSRKYIFRVMLSGQVRAELVRRWARPELAATRRPPAKPAVVFICHWEGEDDKTLGAKLKFCFLLGRKTSLSFRRKKAQAFWVSISSSGRSLSPFLARESSRLTVEIR